MDDPRIRFAHDSLTLLSAAERFQQGSGDRACATFLPAALRTAAECCARTSHLVAASMPGLEHRSATPKAA